MFAGKFRASTGSRPGIFFGRGKAFVCAFAAFLFLAIAASALAAPPVYQLQFLGNGSPSAINNNGTVVGARLTGNNYAPLVSLNGAAWSALPTPANAMSCFPTDVNDSGVIVGVSFDAQWNPTAVRWSLNKGNHVVEILPRLPGQNSSYALGINNLGQIVGSRSSLGYSPTGTGWLYSDTLGPVDLTVFNFWVYPRAINDNAIIIGGQERLNFNTGQVDVIGNGPSNYNPVGGVAINNSGQIAGTAALRSSSLNIVSLFRYEGASGWRYITGTSRYTMATSINNLGDIGFSELGPGVYYDNDRFYGVSDLLDPVWRNQGWAITGAGVYLNDLRSIATVGRNSLTGESGGVLLTATGQIPPPTAPSNLTGVAHPGTRMEPYNSINLSWQNTSILTRSYELQRSESGAGVWTSLALTPPGTGLNHIDTTVGVGVLYDYRVRAVGIGGPSVWSDVITVRAPTTPLDTTPPVATILSPTDGANVSGVVPVNAQATDNVAVEYLEISFWNQYTGQEVIIGSAANGGPLTANWDTRGLNPATYRLRAYAYDMMGNWTTRDIQANVGAAPATLMRVTNISLSAIGRSTVMVTGRVTVRDINGDAVRSALVTAEWTLPSGETATQTSITNSSGTATFWEEGRRGTFTLRIVSVTKNGLTFDPANSVMTKSVTR